MAGGPSQLELLDYKPALGKLHQSELPESIRMGQRITTMTTSVMAAWSGMLQSQPALTSARAASQDRGLLRWVVVLFILRGWLLCFYFELWCNR